MRPNTTSEMNHMGDPPGYWPIILAIILMAIVSLILSCTPEDEICNCTKYERIIYPDNKFNNEYYSLPFPTTCQEPYEWQQDREETIQGTRMIYEYKVECE